MSEKYRSKNKQLLYEYLTTGSKEAYDELFINNLKLISHIIFKTIHYENKSPNEINDEFFSTGAIGLHKAIVSFNLDKIDEINFATYASICIRNEILMELRENRKEVDIVLSFDEDVSEDTEKITIKDVIEDPDNNIEEYNEEEFYLYKKRKIEEALSTLNHIEREIVELYYGFNDKKPLTQAEIADIFNLSRSYISRIIEGINIYLAEKLQEFNYENKPLPSNYKKYTPKTNNLKIANESKKTKKLTALFDKYDMKQIKNAISMLNEENRKILELYIGINNKSLSPQQISKILNISPNSVSSRISVLLDKIRILIEDPSKITTIQRKKNKILNKEKFNEFIEKYGKEKIYEEINKLENKKREILEEYFGLNGIEEKDVKEIALMHNCNVSNIRAKIYKYLDLIEKRIINPEITSIKRTRKVQRTINLFTKYGETNVIEAISKLPIKDKKIIEMYFGINDVVQKSVNEISEIENIKVSSLYTKIRRIENKIIKIIENPNPDINIKEKKQKKISHREKVVMSLYEKYGKNEVINALLKFNERDQIILMYYGIDGNGIKDINEIANLTNLKPKSLATIAGTKLKKLINILENPNYKSKNKSRDNVADFLYEKYGKNEVISAFLKLNEKDQRILMYYGIDGNGLKNPNELSSIVNINPKSLSVIAHKKLKKLIDKLENPNEPIKQTKRSTRNIEKLYEKYGEDKVLETINNLKEKDKNILELYYGLNSNNMYSVNEIKEILNIDTNNIQSLINSKIAKLKKMLENPNYKSKNKSRDNVADFLYEKYGKNEVINALLKFNLKDQLVLMYYGIDGNGVKKIKEISYLLNIEEDSLVVLANKKLKELTKLLKDPTYTLYKKNKKLDNLFSLYGEKEVIEVINKLKPKDKKILCLYYGLDGNEAMDINEIAKMFNIKESSITALVSNKLKIVENIIKNPNDEIVIYKDKNTIKLNSLFEKYGKEKVIEAINKIETRDRDIVYSFFGIENKEPITLKEISEKYNLSISYSSILIKRILKKTEDILLNKKQENKHRTPIITKKEVVGIDKLNEIYGRGTVLEGYNSLSKKGREVLGLYYGIGSEAKTIKEIATILNLSERGILMNVSKSVNQLIKYIENSKDVILNEYNTMLDRLYIVHGEKKVQMAINRLSDNDQISLKQYKENKSIYNKETVIKLINNLKDELQDIEDENTFNPVLIAKRQKLFYDSLLVKDKSLLKEIMQNNLSVGEQKAIFIYYGLNGKDICNISNLAKVMKTSNYNVRMALRKSIEKINNLMKDKVKDKRLK